MNLSQNYLKECQFLSFLCRYQLEAVRMYVACRLYGVGVYGMTKIT